MATLTQTSKTARQVLLVIVGIAVLILGGDFLLRLANRVVEISRPAVDLWQAPDEIFGLVKAPTIASLNLASDSPKPEFVIEGALPSGKKAPTSAFVYRIPRPQITLSTTDAAKQVAATLGFVGQVKQTQPAAQSITMEWQNAAQTRTLRYEITPEKEVWRLRTQYFFDSVAQAPKTLEGDEVSYRQKGAGVLSALVIAPETLRNGDSIATFALLGVDGFFSKPINPVNADYVDFQARHQLKIAGPRPTNQIPQTQRDDTPETLTGKVYVQDPRLGSASIVMSNKVEDLKRDVFSIDYTRFNYNETDYGVYPIITALEAWDLARQGKGAITLLQMQTDDYYAANKQLKIRKLAAAGPETELAFFEPNTWQQYLTPVYIFRGRAETTDGQSARFVIYVDAIERL
jgi:hypothetical protein